MYYATKHYGNQKYLQKVYENGKFLCFIIKCNVSSMNHNENWDFVRPWTLYGMNFSKKNGLNINEISALNHTPTVRLDEPGTKIDA